MTLGTVAFLALASPQFLVSALMAKESVHVLQRKGLARNVPTPSPELQQVLPIAWVHIPKTGSSFINTLIHTPGVCPDLPEDLVVNRTTYGGMFLKNFKEQYPWRKFCPGLLESVMPDHAGIEEQWGDSARAWGHMMVMMRKPKQRIISNYHDLQGSIMSHDSPQEKCRSWGGWPNNTLPSIPQYAQQNRGCATRMLTRPGCPCGGWEGPTTQSEVEEAKRKLREGFSFVGITDRWAESMCLFNSMFKLPCHGYQFMDSRLSPMKQRPEDNYPPALLGGVTDPYDGELYREATAIFEENLRRYNVSEDSCNRCMAEAAEKYC